MNEQVKLRVPHLPTPHGRFYSHVDDAEQGARANFLLADDGRWHKVRSSDFDAVINWVTERMECEGHIPVLRIVAEGGRLAVHMDDTTMIVPAWEVQAA
ncbi:hypothetical protein [Engelhardtia mirabilis]|uniref:Uncharacterized protein n=1 Tax=Engelhardtia mirabilis TaxID=2528011 RepID=A0A518BK16_9BACT|nr:hypothetical protein Pla133_24000 [Planctomycetes bacterium Pla133]QDV01645.1 hypothetical protein Pla86_23990 [Planctomycetes bacterium Pla86]